MDISGATVYRGILGYGVKGHTHKQNLLHTADLPVIIAVVEAEQKLSLAAEAVEEMLQDGLIVVSDVDIVRLIHPHSQFETKPEATPEGTDAKLPAS
jgi:PII-like signaling protein